VTCWAERITRIAVVLPTVFVSLFLLIASLVGTAWLQAHDQARTLSEIASRDVNVRTAASALSIAVNDINIRLLGVLGGVYSASGSAANVEHLFGGLQSNWSTLAGLLAGTESQKLLDPLAKGYAELAALKPKIVDALKGSYVEQVAQVYDRWLDVGGPFREGLQAAVAGLDARGAQKISGVLADADRGARFALILGVASGLIGLIGGAYVLLGVTRPLASIERAIRDLGSGRRDALIRETRRQDEVGKIVEALRLFQSSLAENDVLRTDQVAQADRAQRERRELRAKFTGDLRATICKIAEALGAAAAKIEKSVGRTHDLVAHTEDQARQAAASAAKANENFQSVAGASRQLTSSIAEIGQRVSRSAEIVTRATEQGAQTNATISALQGAVTQIEQVVDLIRAVAGKTNLLALNATIEAARAGEVGRGFSVVATEVKQLAAQTAQATSEIAPQIAAVQEASQDVLHAIIGITATIEQISQFANEIASAVGEQELATVEIARSVDEVVSGANQISESANQVTSAAAESGRQAADLKIAADELKVHSATLRNEIDEFVRRTEAA